MKSLSEKLKSKVSRRVSENDDFDLSAITSARRHNSLSNIVIMLPEAEETPSPSRLRATSLSLHTGDTRSRSRSATRRNTKDLIRQETYQVIQKKLLHILEDVGLQLPIPLKTNVSGFSGSQSKVLKIYVANSNDCVYLSPALSTSFNYEDADNGGNELPEAEPNHDTEELEDSPENVACDTAHSLDALHAKMKGFNSPNYLCTRLDSDLPIPHLFGIVIELKKEASVRKINVNFLSVVKTLWLAAEGNFRHQYEEKFDIGALDWNLSLSEADYFINTSNSNDTKTRDIEPEHLAKRTRTYYLNSLRRSRYLSESSASFNDSGSEHVGQEPSSPLKSASSAEIYKAGIYVFLLPVLLPYHIPASVNAINGSLAHKLAVKISDVSEKSSLKKTSIKSNYQLPMVRTPPSMANSVADKPIHVNRTWNDSLHYSITFPRKYVSLGSEHTINVQLVPLVKDVSIKRIKFNILERMTYVSKDLTREYDYDGQDPLASKQRSKKCKERVVPLCELKTKSKHNTLGFEPFKEEVIACPNNNLLFSCYEKEPATSKDKERKNDVLIAAPLDINIALPFLTSLSDKDMLTSSIIESDREQRTLHSTTSRKSSMKDSISRKESIASSENLTSPIIGSLETHISHLAGVQNSRDSVDEDVLKISSSSLLSHGSSSFNDSFMRGVTTTSRALSPDSNFRHIQISHRLQVCFRILRPDPKDDYKIHHYEVVVDTPVVLLSAKCNDESIQLPKYDDLEDKMNEQVLPEFESPSLSRPAISFRMPSFQENGISIKPLVEQRGEQLPSFEEATSGPSSPRIRSASLVSLDPTMPSDPAPAYAAQSFESSTDTQSTIDDLLVEERVTPKRRNESALRSSLQSSFAPVSPLPVSSLTEASDSHGSVALESSEIELDAGSSSTAKSKSSSQSIEESPEVSSNLETRSECPVDLLAHVDFAGKLHLDNNDVETEGAELDISTDPEVEEFESGEARRPRLNHNMTGLSVDGLRGETQNIFGQDVSFDQKLLLLQNESSSDLTPQQSQATSDGGAKKATIPAGFLTDTLDESGAQSLYHAY